MGDEFDRYGMRPMTEEEAAPFLKHPKVTVVDDVRLEHDDKELTVYSKRGTSIEYLLDSFNECEKVYLYPPGLKYQKGYKGEPDRGPMFANPYPPQYWIRVREIKNNGYYEIHNKHGKQGA